MPAAAVVTLVLAALLVLALAVTLIWVVVLLRRITGTLEEVTTQVRAVAERTRPLGPAVAAVNANLRAAADELEDLTRPPHREQAESHQLPAEHR